MLNVFTKLFQKQQEPEVESKVSPSVERLCDKLLNSDVDLKHTDEKGTLVQVYTFDGIELRVVKPMILPDVYEINGKSLPLSKDESDYLLDTLKIVRDKRNKRLQDEALSFLED